MSEVEILLDKDIYYPGEILSGTVIFNPKKKVKFDELHIEFEGDLKTVVRVSHGKHTYTYREHVKLINSKKVFDTKGEFFERREYKFSFQIPSDVPPYFDGFKGDILYTLTARIVIPFWFDKVISKSVFILPKPKNVFISPKKIIFPKVKHEKPYVELVLPTFDFYPSGNIPIKICLNNFKKYRGVRFELTAREKVVAKRHVREVTFKRLVYNFKKEDIPADQWCIVHLRIPSSVPFSINENLINLYWILKITVDIPWRFDISQQISINMVMPSYRVDDQLISALDQAIFETPSEQQVPPEYITSDSSSAQSQVSSSTTASSVSSPDISTSSEAAAKYSKSLYDAQYSAPTSFDSSSQMESDEISEPEEISDEYRELHKEFEPLRYYGELKFIPYDSKFDRVTLTPSFGAIKSVVIDILPDEFHFVVKGTTSINKKLTASISGRVKLTDDILTAEKILSSLRIRSSDKEFEKTLKSNLELGYAFVDIDGPFSVDISTDGQEFSIELNIMRKPKNIAEAYDVIKALAWVIDTFY